MKKIFLTAFTGAMAIFNAQQSSQDLANKLSNPVASMISVPLASTADFGIGTLNGSRWVSNLQPVIPIKVNQNWNLITRTILPIVELRNITAPNKNDVGISDINFSAFFSPSNSQKLIWGIGPALVIPTASESFLGTQKWSTGPTALVLKQAGGITYGMLARQVWSIAGNDARQDVNELFMQPFLAYNFKSGAGLSANMELTQNWENKSFSGYFIAVGSMLSTFGNQPVSFGLGPKIPITKDADGDWGLRASITFIFK